MSVEIRDKGGRLIGELSDSLDQEDFLIVNSKKVRLSDVYRDKKLKDDFNDSIKKSSNPIVPEEDDDNK